MSDHEEHHDDAHAEGHAAKSGGSHGGHGGGHGGGGGHEEGHEGAPEWLISFADNVTLMMGFFVIMLALNLGPKGGSDSDGKKSGAEQAAAGPTADMLDLAISLREAFHNPVNPASMDPDDKPLIDRMMQRRGQVPIDEDGPRGNAYELQSLRRGKYPAICGSIPFATDSTAFTEEAERTLANVHEHLRGYNMVIDVRGHVSALEASNTKDRGVRLSFERAMVVVDALVRLGLSRGQLRPIPSGDMDRVKAAAYDAEGHGLNQRVELILTEDVAPEYAVSSGEKPAKPSAGAGLEPPASQPGH